MSHQETTSNLMTCLSFRKSYLSKCCVLHVSVIDRSSESNSGLVLATRLKRQLVDTV